MINPLFGQWGIGARLRYSAKTADEPTVIWAQLAGGHFGDSGAPGILPAHVRSFARIRGVVYLTPELVVKVGVGCGNW